MRKTRKLKTENRTSLILPTLLIVGCLLRWPAGGLAVEVRATLNRDTIYLGAPALLRVDVADPANMQWPVVAPVDGLQITPYGQPTAVRDLFSGSVQLTYGFLITPARAGDFKITSVTVGSGPGAITRGPFALHVIEAALKFLDAQVEPLEIRPGEKAHITVSYQGTRPGKGLALPVVKGLTLRAIGSAQVQMTAREGLPISQYRLEATASQVGAYEVKGVSLDGVPADPVTVRVSPFVITQSQVEDSSLVVGGKTLVHVVVRGLPSSAGLKLVAPPGLRIQSTSPRYAAPTGTAIFAFEVTATEPGAPTITTLQLTDGSQAPLARPIKLSVRSSGEGNILDGRATVRSKESVLGEPFIVDYEVFFRGDLREAAIDLSQAEFANRPYIKVQPIDDLSYPKWTGQRVPVSLGGAGGATMLFGSGELDGKKEQVLRFALKVTPRAAGELELKGVRVILALQITEEHRGPGTYSRSTRSQPYVRVIDAPAHRVTDPQGVRQPVGYHGAVGASFTYSTTLDRTTATAMSSLTLTLKITGDGVSSEFKPPPLAEIPELVRDFDLSPTTGGGDVQGNTITFTQVIHPRSEAVKELPALPLVFYNYAKKQYETVYSLPIPITVTPGSVVDAADMQTRSAPGASSASSGGAATQPGGVASVASVASAGRPSRNGEAEVVSPGANHTTLGQLEAGQPLGLGGVIAVLLAGPGVILAVWIGRNWQERRRPLAAVRRQRGELTGALEQVAGRDDFYVALAELVQSYLRLTFDLPPGEISAEMLAGRLDVKAVDGDVRKTIEELLARCDTGRFTAAGADEAEKTRLTQQARRLFAGLDRL